MPYRIPVSAPDLSGNEESYLVEALRSSWISSSGKFVDAFERDFARACSARFVVGVCNGTAALHLAMLAMGLRPGDEVIVPNLSYVATANAVRYVGARPVFVDVDPLTWCIDPELVEHVITERTRGIIPVHLYGVPAEMDALARIASIHGLWLVEDAAEAHGAEYHGIRVGAIGKAGIFSFYGNKILTCGEGGAVVVNDEALNIRLRTLRGQGVDPCRRYFHPVVGYNFRLTNLACAILCAQLERADAMVTRRRAIVQRYRNHLVSNGYVAPIPQPNTVEAPWLATFRAPFPGQREMVVKLLEEAGIETRPVFIPITLLPPYHDAKRSACPVSRDIAQTGFCLPTYVGLSDDQIDEICHIILGAS